MPIISLPDANPSLPEHKIGVFVLFWASKPSFSGISSTKSRFLCFFGLRDPHFRAFRAQNRGFCALFAFGTPVFGHFEHKIEVFVLFWPSEPPFSGISSTKSGFLCVLSLRNPRFRTFRAHNRHFCALRWGHGWGDGQEQQERRPGQFGLLTFCHKGALFELWHSI